MNKQVQYLDLISCVFIGENFDVKDICLMLYCII